MVLIGRFYTTHEFIIQPCFIKIMVARILVHGTVRDCTKLSYANPISTTYIFLAVLNIENNKLKINELVYYLNFYSH